MKKISLIAVLLITLFVVNVSAGPLNSFEQNPLPYWDDDSLGVTANWDSGVQTITIDDTGSKDYDYSSSFSYSESFTVVSDWITWIDASFSTDGNIGYYDTAGDNSLDHIYTNVPEITQIQGLTLTVRWKSNVSNTYAYIQCFTGDDHTGSGVNVLGTYRLPNTYEIKTLVIPDDMGLESLGFATKGASAFRFNVDYLHIGNADLDIGVPIIQQEQQTIEVYVNSTDLNSEVRLEIYDGTQALGTYCVFNSSYVVFPDNEYAQTDGLARIEFTLNNEYKIATISVFAANSSLINHYNDTSSLSGTTHLRMTDPVFNESIILYYFNGDTSYSAEYSIIEELFLNTNFIGYIGPLALVFVGYVLVKKDRGLGLIAFIVQSLFIAQYFVLVESTPDYWWHIFILIFGMLFTVVFQLWDR